MHNQLVSQAIKKLTDLQRSSLEAFVAHELGHSVMGDEDDGPGHMNNIKRNENPVRRALNEPERTEY